MSFVYTFGIIIMTDVSHHICDDEEGNVKELLHSVILMILITVEIKLHIGFL
jgi:hypothetical protein